jgi:hypothetical protein
MTDRTTKAFVIEDAKLKGRFWVCHDERPALVSVDSLLMLDTYLSMESARASLDIMKKEKKKIQAHIAPVTYRTTFAITSVNGVEVKQ